MSKTTLYIGDKVLKGVKKNIATFADGSTETFTDKQLSYVITKEPKDLTQFRDLVLDNVIPELMDVIEAHDIRKGDLNAVIQAMNDTYNFLLLEATGKAFGTYKEGRHPSYFQEDIKISDIKRVTGK